MPYVSLDSRLSRYVQYSTDYAFSPIDYEAESPEEVLSSDRKQEIYNTYLKTLDEGLKGKESLEASCPMSVRQLILAQEHDRATEKGYPNPEYIRMKSLFAGTVGFAFTLAARIVRVALRTIFSPITGLHAFYQQKKYGVKGWAKEHCNRIAREWVDLGVTLATPFIGIVHFVRPQAIDLSKLRNYYIRKMDTVLSKNEKFETKRSFYLKQQQAIAEAWRTVKAE